MSEVSPGKLTRQQLYDRIRETSKDEYILSEMKRLGFWEDSEKPSLSEELIKEKAKLQKELNQLLRSKRLMKDPLKALEMMHKERKKQALENRKKTKIERIKSAYQKALNWYNINRQKITYLGESSNIEISLRQTNDSQLKQQGLPVYTQALELAETMGISLSELRFLTFNRQVSKVIHYKRFNLAKKTGGVREISAPMPRLKRLQYWLKANVLEKVDLHDAAHGFIRERSIVTNALPHVGQSIVINMDLQNFFPTISYRRVKGMFQRFGYSEEISILLALLSTEPKCDEVEMDGETFFVAQGERVLPQGAPTSPVIANIICRKLDRRITDCAKKLGFSYTRYADDLTFSGQQNDSERVQQLLWRVRSIIQDEGFILHPDKTKVMRSHQQQEVTGIVVNEKPNLSRKKRKQLRATLFQIEKDGLNGKHWQESDDVLRSLIGFVNYYNMIDPGKAAIYKSQLNRIISKHQAPSYQDAFLGKMKKATFIDKSANGEAPWTNWWQPAEKQAPELILPKEKAKKTSSSTTANAATNTGQIDRQAARQDSDSNSSTSTETIGKVFITLALVFLGVVLFNVSPIVLVFIAIALYRLWN